MKQLLTDILNRIKTDIPAIKYVDEDWGQLDNYSPNPPVQFPAAIVDCVNATYSNQGNLVQLGDVQVRIRIADLKLTNTSGRAPQTQRDNAFAIYNLLEEIHSKLHGWPTNKHYTRLIRQSLKRTVRNDGMRVHELIYTTRITDTGAMPQTVSVPKPQADVNYGLL